MDFIIAAVCLLSGIPAFLPWFGVGKTDALFLLLFPFFLGILCIDKGVRDLKEKKKTPAFEAAAAESGLFPQKIMVIFGLALCFAGLGGALLFLALAVFNAMPFLEYLIPAVFCAAVGMYLCSVGERQLKMKKGQQGAFILRRHKRFFGLLLYFVVIPEFAAAAGLLALSLYENKLMYDRLLAGFLIAAFLLLFFGVILITLDKQERKLVLWIFACYDYTSSRYSEGDSIYSENNAISFARSRFSVANNQTINFIKPGSWNAPEITVTPNSIDVDLKKAYSAIAAYLTSYGYEKQEIMGAKTEAVEWPDLGMLLIYVNLLGKPKKEERSNGVWVFECYDNERAPVLSVFSNSKQYFSEEHAVETVREHMSIDGSQSVIFVKSAEWGAPSAKVNGSSFKVDINAVNSSIIKYLSSRGFNSSEVANALAVSNAIAKPNLGQLLFCVDLRKQ